jgi:tellurium resistance protein TerD
MVTVSDMIGKANLPATAAGTVLHIQKDSGVKTIAGGIEWDSNTGPRVDVDIWMLLLGANGQVIDNNHFIFYNNRFAPGNVAYVTEDNRDGSDTADKATKSDGYDELAVVNFDELPSSIVSVIVGVSIDHTAAPVQGQTFKDTKNARCIIYDLTSKKVLAKCDMSANMGNFDAIVLGKYARGPTGFTFESIMKGTAGGIMDAIRPYGLN